ncbi:uncharacterized protein PFL1_01442 [Pseudozyma flocculosa PF-1]|uniref:Mitogen-activated protein kinase n=1 Tax=Pseudozyma flocculosa TaxID=84751 RepID=A0A5C3EVF5_9BASI|nr:uncharacterized protein PFL1_01442 [Pseudozyma flocculosa PF-1]EPQ31257.1 hypothetical protein PFL1_01442 [Pseudozyma flocculosa PF-1]SPO36244.1 related to MAP kinase [Pseudozyma flocculosa]
MPAPNATSRSPPPAAAQAGSSRTPSPPSPSSSLHQVGSRQATRTRTRTRRNVSSSLSTTHRIPHYTHEDHPLSPHNLDRHGYHSFRCLGVPFHVKKRYTFLRELGIGAYGCVALCRDEALDCNVAIKKVTRVFERDVLARRALREVAILRHIGMCDNVTALLDFDATFIEFSEIYLVLSASEADLSQIIRSGQALSDAHHQYFVAQILRGVRYMHAAKVVHRDLKPGNLLVNADCALRLCDFGLARAYADPSFGAGPAQPCDNDELQMGEADEHDPLEGRDGQSQERGPDGRDKGTAHLSRSLSPQSDLKLHTQRRDSKGKQRRLNYPGGPLTEYVATRWYRAPEVMLCFREGYGPELDMWSVGCILAELIGGQPIFPGKDYVDQITRINSVLGSPSDSVVDKIGSERAKTYIKALPRMPAVPLQNLYPTASPEAVDLLSRLLTWDPAERLTADEALRHPWLKAYHESNARWQPPPAFDKFAEVEYIRSLREFKAGLQREADEVRQEIEALEMEEAEALDGSSTSAIDAGDGDDDDEREQQLARESTQPENGPESGQLPDTDAHGDVAGNGSRADASQRDDEGPNTDAEPQHEGHGSSCGTSARSCNLPEALASSGSSADTLSSTETSGDEADPPSPRSLDGCRVESATQPGLRKDGQLAQVPSYFRLGHEEEGRQSIKPLLDDNRLEHRLVSQLEQRFPIDDVFVPDQLLQVAQGLVEHQINAAASSAAAAEAAMSDQTLGSKGASFFSPGGGGVDPACLAEAPSDSAGAGSGPTIEGGRAGALLSSRPSTAVGSGGTGASTPSLGQGLLDNVAIAPASSASTSGHGVQRHSKQLVLVQDGLLQSSAGLLAQMIARAADKAQPTLLVTILRHPSTYVRPRDMRHVTLLDGSSRSDGYCEEDDGEGRSAFGLASWKGVAQAVLAKLGRMGAQNRLTIMIDSLDTLVEQSRDGVEGAFNLVRTLLGKLSALGRLVVGFQGDSSSTSAALVSALNTNLVWSASNDGGDAASTSAAASGTILTARLHAPAVMRYIYRNYGLRPSSSSAAVFRALHPSEVSGAREKLSDDTTWSDLEGIGEGHQESDADARFWEILRNTSSRGALGIPAYEGGGGTAGWWANGSIAADEVECVFKRPTPLASRSGPTHAATVHGDRICFEDIVGAAAQDGETARSPRSNSWGFLELHYQARSGKVYEELVGCVVESSSHGRKLFLRPLDMVDRRDINQALPQPAPPALPSQPSIASGSGPEAATSSRAAGADPHASMVSRLPFNLSETDAQRARREDVPLPYAFYQHSAQGGLEAQQQQQQQQQQQGMRGSTGKSTIFFEPEAGDDEDDEDPDDDLDL